MKNVISLLLAALCVAAAAPRAEAYDSYRCGHYLRAARSYMMAGRYDKSRAELAKADREGCPSNIPFN
jgi:hypothetical protein